CLLARSAPTAFSSLSLHDALPISFVVCRTKKEPAGCADPVYRGGPKGPPLFGIPLHPSQSRPAAPALALSVTALTRRATSPARVGGSPLRHSPLARPVPPLPHAGEAKRNL